MRANGLTENGRDLVQYYLDGSPFANEADDTVDIVRFGDVIGTGAGQVPAATILDAQLFYSTGDAADAVSGGPYQLGRLDSEVPEGAIYTDFPLDPQSRRSVRALTTPTMVGCRGLHPGPGGHSHRHHRSGAGLVLGRPESRRGDFHERHHGRLAGEHALSHPDTAKRPRLSVTFTTGATRMLEVPANTTALVQTNGAVEITLDRPTVVMANAPADPIGLLLRFDGVFGTNTSQVGTQERVVGAKLLLQTAGWPELRPPPTARAHSPCTRFSRNGDRPRSSGPTG